MNDLLERLDRWGLSPTVEVSDHERQRIAICDGRVTLERLRDVDYPADWVASWAVMDRDTGAHRLVLADYPRGWVRHLGMWWQAHRAATRRAA